jgi:hypothetical protein
MSEIELKPLHWTPDPNVGFTVERRPDGGMNVTFTEVTSETWEAWRTFALDHLIDSDRLTRNLYDLRQIHLIPDEAMQTAIEANSDPSSRNIRLAVVVANEAVRAAVQKIAALTPSSSAEIRIFTDIDEAEDWLNRPLHSMV